MNRRLLLRAVLILLVGGAALAAVLASLYMAREREARETAQVLTGKTFAEPGQVPIGGPFTLVDHIGRTVTEKDFGGRYLLVFFGFSNCPDVCPTTLGDIASALDLLGAEADAVQPLFVSLDPERDTPERLAEYVAAFHPKIVGLTGTAEQIAAVAKEYRAFYEKVSAASYYAQEIGGADDKSAPGDDYLISHQGNTYLMSPKSEYLTHFTYGTKPEEMAKTVRKAIAKFGNPAAEK